MGTRSVYHPKANLGLILLSLLLLSPSGDLRLGHFRLGHT